ncbi:NADH-quinone oxidoreductase subunit C [Candidatus Aciduliprofundum boonei]|uniref:NADH dehydrogenase (Ubiquinone) 30 kDa subunit n=1 Tax=Aciduliprofundum boonei (strain DSM 19572 / T469) TaxID=439481 RepID=B5I9P0_ACIB4|nr:NADH-quinone oxidoreductase subunit C [Candidatus Aciduliprofundum boonei]ADD08485.1 NADH dehydrogenase (ubiquinone) 30 kDa subunit [Aciduliprofundum boonei T469]EDY36362.1 Respiratory-chain NADH dehydrogenase, 30 Kd subunit domain protein [Aciduliprofundum boonei T469]EDY36857.1 Respiratory-chain NADH dehydrogenase, 30 Kd subunit domain protein [Aciduliprofundum boonei T469]HII55310.1 NADH-quinone oxidoreductase subunit C [Candidatus Aciduliprofundum boonei]
MKTEDVINMIKKRIDCEINIKEIPCGLKKIKRTNIFVNIKREDFRKFMDLLFEIQDYPHFAVISVTDLGEDMELLYHFTIDYGKQNDEKTISLRVKLPKNDLRIETITDLIPGAMISEREIHEMVGVDFIGLEDTRHFFLPENWPEGKYPWRRDETFPSEMLNKLYETWKEDDKDE